MYYMSEFQSSGRYREAVKLNAKTLTAAKREASRKQTPHKGILYITNDEGLFKDELGVVHLKFSKALAVKLEGCWKQLNELF